MAKILISFVGTGSLVNRVSAGHNYIASERQYKKAKYHIGEENFECPFKYLNFLMGWILIWQRD